jgi:hypothetical protein
MLHSVIIAPISLTFRHFFLLILISWQKIILSVGMVMVAVEMFAFSPRFSRNFALLRRFIKIKLQRIFLLEEGFLLQLARFLFLKL